MECTQKKRLVIGCTGASGAPIAVELLQQLRAYPQWEAHLVYSSSFLRTLAAETTLTEEAFCALADVVYDNHDIGAAIASGTFRTEGMAIVPCSMKSAAGVACGFAENLLLRAADVTLKERRRLVLLAREAPLSSIHLRNLLTLSDAGAIILPPVLAYYYQPREIADLTRQVACRTLHEFGLVTEQMFCWGEPCTQI